MTKRSKDAEFERQESVSPEAAETQAPEPIVLTEDSADSTEANAGWSHSPAEFAEVEKLHTQLAESEKELAEFKDKYLRTLADTENIRKRVRQQSEETVRIQRENMLRDLLPMIDNLERAVEAARGGGNGKSIVEGVEMVLRSMIDYLRTQGVTPLHAIGQPFDPQLHEAVDHVASSEHPPNTVVEEFHRGYQIGDRMLRPARVSVAKMAPADAGPGTGHAPQHKDGKTGDGEVENN
ncbi:MAG: nucleotide exchange factor GrpE [Candidatus Binataceae bacterium]